MPSSSAVRAAVAAEVARLVARHESGSTRDPELHTIVDLGSGWGGLAREMALRFPDRTVIGVEASPLPHLCAALTRAVAGPPNLNFRRADFRSMTPEVGTLYLCFLSPEAMREVHSVFGNQGERENVVISALFGVRGWTPTRTTIASDVYRTEVFVYEA